jgi:hypothetical protein
MSFNQTIVYQFNDLNKHPIISRISHQFEENWR